MVAPKGLKLHGSYRSTCAQRVYVVAKELGIDIDLVEVNFAKGEHKSEDYVNNKQPFGQVPVLEDNGFLLFESRAIGRYLVETYGEGSKLIPTDPKKKALFEQAASVEAFDFDPYASGVTGEKVFKPMFGKETDEARAEQLTTTLKEKLKGYEIILKKQKFLAGDELTIADLFHLPYGTMVTNNVGLDLLTSSETPNVARWWKDVSSRDSWQKVLALGK